MFFSVAELVEIAEVGVIGVGWVLGGSDDCSEMVLELELELDLLTGSNLTTIWARMGLTGGSDSLWS